MHPNEFERVSLQSGNEFYLYFSPDFIEDIEKTGINQKSVFEVVHQLRTYGASERDMLGSFVYWKEKDNTYGFIFQELRDVLGIHTVICFQRVIKPFDKDQRLFNSIKRGHKEYAQKFKEHYQKKIELNLKKWIDIDFLIQKKEIDRKKLELQKELDLKKAWLSTFKLDISFDVYESKDWVEFSVQKKVTAFGYDFLKLFYLVVTNACNVIEEVVCASDRTLKLAFLDNVILLFEEMILVEDLKKVYFIHNGDIGVKKGGKIEFLRKEEIIRNAINNEKFQFEIIEGKYRVFEVSRAADRAYPKDIILDPQNEREFWMNIQSQAEDNANLSLLPDQVQLLRNLNFPIFINGQAGSGKSTLLFYIFAEVLWLKLIDNVPSGKILFLTENKYLLDTSRGEIVNILFKNPRYAEWMREYASSLGVVYSKEWLESIVSEYFFTFQNFLVSRIEEGHTLFPKKKFLNFYKFKERYNLSTIDKSLKSKYSAEVVWFVIRTFIKGYVSDRDELLPSQFNSDVVRDDKGDLDFETYRVIFEELYQKFYKNQLIERDGYWDYLDLVKVLLKSNKSLGEYSIILSDEAQDFTKLELQLLIKFSEFSDGYDLSNLQKFPIVFAGDPFQTINPTGFSWDRLKTMFYQDVIKRFSLNVEIKSLFSQLLMNYRSTPSIVKLANCIQFFRICYLNENKDTKPQNTRLQEKGALPIFLTVKDNLNDLVGLDSSIMVISNCELDEEEYFKKHDGLDLDLFVINSPAVFKGREMEKVVIYKFGDWFWKEILSIERVKKHLSKYDINLPFDSLIQVLINKESEQISSDFNFRLAYFFNKLYVAVTRARSVLYVVDTADGADNFWTPFLKFVKLGLQDLEPNNPWRKKILDEADEELIVFENNLAIVQSIEKGEIDESTLSSANKARRDGILMNDVEMLEKIAIPYYRKMGFQETNNSEKRILKYQREIDICKAYIYFFKLEYAKASELFLKVNYNDEAIRCSWLDADWRRILSIDKGPSVYVFFANFFSRNVFDLTFFLEHIGEISEILKDYRLEWHHKFELLIKDHFYDDEKKNLYSPCFFEIAESFNCLSSHGYIFKALSAHYYFLSGNYYKAYKLWDLKEEVNNPYFFYSKYLYLQSQIDSIEVSTIEEHYFDVLDSLLDIFFLKKDQPFMLFFQEENIDLEGLIDEYLKTIKNYSVHVITLNKLIQFFLVQGDFKRAMWFTLAVYKNESDEVLWKRYHLILDGVNFRKDDLVGIFFVIIQELKAFPNHETEKIIPKQFFKYLHGRFIYYFKFRKRLSLPDDLNLTRINEAIFSCAVNVLGLSSYTPNYFFDLFEQDEDFNSFVNFFTWFITRYKASNQIDFDIRMSALERLNNKYKDVLSFYEEGFKAQIPDTLFYFMRNRWLRVMVKRIEQDLRTGQSGRSLGEYYFTAHFRQFLERLDKWGLDLKEQISLVNDYRRFYSSSKPSEWIFHLKKWDKIKVRLDEDLAFIILGIKNGTTEYPEFSRGNEPLDLSKLLDVRKK